MAKVSNQRSDQAHWRRLVIVAAAAQEDRCAVMLADSPSYENIDAPKKRAEVSSVCVGAEVLRVMADSDLVKSATTQAKERTRFFDERQGSSEELCVALTLRMSEVHRSLTCPWQFGRRRWQWRRWRSKHRW